jgi:hypothetical protein
MQNFWHDVCADMTTKIGTMLSHVIHWMLHYMEQTHEKVKRVMTILQFQNDFLFAVQKGLQLYMDHPICHAPDNRDDPTPPPASPLPHGFSQLKNL